MNCPTCTQKTKIKHRRKLTTGRGHIRTCRCGTEFSTYVNGTEKFCKVLRRPADAIRDLRWLMYTTALHEFKRLGTIGPDAYELAEQIRGMK